MRHVQAEPIQRRRGVRLRSALRKGLLYVSGMKTKPAQPLHELLYVCGSFAEI